MKGVDWSWLTLNQNLAFGDRTRIENQLPSSRADEIESKVRLRGFLVMECEIENCRIDGGDVLRKE